MKASFTTLLGLVGAATAVVQIEVRYSDNMIDVGNLDLMEVTRNTIYAEEGNQRSILTDRVHKTDTKNCKAAEEPDPDLAVQVKLTGAWGRTPGLGDNDMREGLVSSIYEVLTTVAAESTYDIYTNCRGGTWQESVGYVPEAACGRLASNGVSCSDVCKKDVASPGTTQCMNVTQGHRVPSLLRVTAYIDNALQPDDLIFEFAATSEAKSGGCGLIGKIASKLAVYTIPVVGGLFAEGITLGCAA